MDRKKLVNLAKNLGVKEHLYEADKKTLVREIQRALGQEPCYLTDLRYNCNETCDWIGCKKLTAAWLR